MNMTRASFLRTAGLGVLVGAQRTNAAPAPSPSPGAAQRIPFRGVVPAALTPFDVEGRIALKEFRRHIAALAAVRGVTAIMVNGAAGQDGALSRDERRNDARAGENAPRAHPGVEEGRLNDEPIDDRERHPGQHEGEHAA